MGVTPCSAASCSSGTVCQNEACRLFRFISRSLHEQILNHPAPRHELKRPLQPVAELEVGGNAQAVIDGGDDVGGRDGVIARPGADAVAGAVDIAAFDTAAGEQEAVAEVP